MSAEGDERQPGGEGEHQDGERQDGERQDRELSQLLRAFVRNGRLASIPVKPAKRLLLLRYLREECFPDEREYTENEVSQRLAAWHDDFAALRRYLVDARLMTRDHGEYRRGPE